MIKDPWTQWEDGIFPYDALAPAGVTPDTGMKLVIEAAGDLIEGGLWSREKQVAWDELRIIKRRLLVDFFMHQMTAEEIIGTLADFCNEPEVTLSIPDLTYLLRPDLGDFQRMEEDFQPVETQEDRLERIADFDESAEAILERLEFDI